MNRSSLIQLPAFIAFRRPYTFRGSKILIYFQHSNLVITLTRFVKGQAMMLHHKCLINYALDDKEIPEKQDYLEETYTKCVGDVIEGKLSLSYK